MARRELTSDRYLADPSSVDVIVVGRPSCGSPRVVIPNLTRHKRRIEGQVAAGVSRLVGSVDIALGHRNQCYFCVAARTISNETLVADRSCVLVLEGVHQ